MEILHITKNINGDKYNFKVSYEIKGIYASINIHSLNNNKFKEISNKSEILENIAVEVLTKTDSKSGYTLLVNQIDSGTEWFGQFKKIKSELTPFG